MPPISRSAVLDELAGEQAGVLSRAQAHAAGVSAQQIRSQLRAQRWQRVVAGVYATFTGPLPPLARVWAGVLHAGRGAAVTGRTALWLHGAVEKPAPDVEVCVPHGRKVRPLPWLRITSSRALEQRRQPAGRPPRVRLEHALLDALDSMSRPGAVVGLLLESIQRRATTLSRLAEALRARGRHRWSTLLRQVLDDATQGTWSALEHHYLVGVERAHGLPRGARNEREPVADTGASFGVGNRTATYRDVRYRNWQLLVELDGVKAHPARSAHSDRLRDNERTLADERTLRFGWYEVLELRCLVASQVIAGLRQRGWSGTPRRCGPACTVTG